MTRKKKEVPNWIDVKRIITGFDKKQLVELAGDLYRLSMANKDFFHARFSLGEEPLEPYKRIIQNAMHPYLEDNETLDITRATDAIRHYSKAVDDAKGEAELMTFFVECGNNFTLSYGDIDEDFYDALLLMYENAIETVMELPTMEQEAFRARLQEVMSSASGIGWGYHNGLCELYHKAFETKDQTPNNAME